MTRKQVVHLKISCLILVLIYNFDTTTSFAQRPPDYYVPTKSPNSSFEIRAGGMYCFTRTVSSSSVRLLGYTDKVTGYIGGLYTRDILSNQIALRTDVGIQAKGTGASYKSVTYYYISAGVALGVHLLPKLTLYLGPEINLLTLKQNSWGEGEPVEIGIVPRLVYQFGTIGLELGYFRAISPYDHLGINSIVQFSNDFYNQNVQLGFTYKILN